MMDAPSRPGRNTPRGLRAARPRRSSGLLPRLAWLGACLVLFSCRHDEGQETVLIAGSTTMFHYLAPVVAAFQAKHPKASVVSEPGGSTAGLVALKRGAIDVATLARDVTPDEDDVRLRDFLVARDGVAIIVHASNPLENLSRHEVSQICSGELRSWKAAGAGAPAAELEKLGEIVLIDRAKSSRTRKSMLDLVLGGDDAMHGAKEVASGDEMLAAVRGDPRAIGYASLRSFTKNPAGVKALRIEDVPMNQATMLTGRYPLTRSFYLALYGQPPKLAEQFVTFVLSPEGQALLEEDGLLGVH